MDVRRTLVLFTLLVASAAPAAGAPEPEELYIGLSTRQSADRTKPPEVKLEFLVIYPNGLALRDLPAGGLDYGNVERFAEKSEHKVGKYTRTDTGMFIEWDPSSRHGNTWNLTADGAGWTLGGGTTVFRPAERVSKDLIKGIWQTGRTGPGSDASNMGPGGEYIFRSNGEYERGRGDAKRGHYELDGYTLILRARNGEESRHVIYRWPWVGGAIAVDKTMYQVLTTRP